MTAPEDKQVAMAAHAFFDSLRAGKVDRSTLDPKMSETITDDQLQKGHVEFARLEPPLWKYLGKLTIDGSAVQLYRLAFSDYTLLVRVRLDDVGKLAAFQVAVDHG